MLFPDYIHRQSFKFNQLYDFRFNWHTTMICFSFTPSFTPRPKTRSNSLNYRFNFCALMSAIAVSGLAMVHLHGRCKYSHFSIQHFKISYWLLIFHAYNNRNELLLFEIQVKSVQKFHEIHAHEEEGKFRKK